MSFRFFSNCVSWPESDVHNKGGLCDLISDCEDITRRTFQRRTDPQERAELEKSLGYSRNGAGGELTMAKDWHVSYHKSKHHGRTVYLFQWSGIEYVFTQPERRAK